MSKDFLVFCYTSFLRCGKLGKEYIDTKRGKQLGVEIHNRIKTLLMVVRIYMRGTKNSWSCLLLILSGIVLGGLIGSIFPGSFLDYGDNFGLVEPVQLDLGVLIITFGLQIKITISSIIGIIIGIVVYRLL